MDTMIESKHAQPDAAETLITVHPIGSELLSGGRWSVVEVSSLLDAVALVARSAHDTPVAAVLVPPGAVDGCPDARDALRRIDASTRLVGVGPAMAFERERSQFDAMLSADANESGGLRDDLDALLTGTFRDRYAEPPAPEAPPAAGRGVVELEVGPAVDAASPSGDSHQAEGAAPSGAAGGDGDDVDVDVDVDVDHDADSIDGFKRHHRDAAALIGFEPPEASRPAPPETDMVLGRDPYFGLTHGLPVTGRPGFTADDQADSNTNMPTSDPFEPASPNAADAPTSPAIELPADEADTPMIEDDPAPPISFADAVRARELAGTGRVPEPPAESEPLGDIDLVDAVMAEEGRLADIAVRLMREQTGWSDLVFVADSRDDVEADPGDGADSRAATWCAVGTTDEKFGELASRMAARDELSRWCDWLARWLELEHRFRQHHRDAVRDELTGAWNRRAFFDFLGTTLLEARDRRRPVNVMVFDIDDFKRFNDDHGHAAGDVILRETVTLLESVTRRGDRVCRIGGDEFAVVFVDHDEGRGQTGTGLTDDVEVIARRFQEQVTRMRFPLLGDDAPGRVSISAGLASYPWDGTTPESLLRVADERSLASKRRGKNHITFGPSGDRIDDHGPDHPGHRPRL